MPLVKQFEKGNYSGIYELSSEKEIKGDFSKDNLEYYFSINLNGKELRYPKK